MKKIFLIISSLFVFISCSVKKKPIFIKVDDVKLVSFAMDTVKIEAKAFFKNPNDVGGKMSTDGIQVFVDEKPIATVKSDEFKVPANKEFQVPLAIEIPQDKIFQKGLLNGLLNIILKDNTIKIRLKGAIKYKVIGFSNTYPVDKTKELKLKI